MRACLIALIAALGLDAFSAAADTPGALRDLWLRDGGRFVRSWLLLGRFRPPRYNSIAISRRRPELLNLLPVGAAPTGTVADNHDVSISSRTPAVIPNTWGSASAMCCDV